MFPFYSFAYLWLCYVYILWQSVKLKYTDFHFGFSAPVTIRGREFFRGFFLQARDAETNEWIGSWQDSQNTKTIPECASITHADPRDKEGANLIWKAPQHKSGRVYFTYVLFFHFFISLIAVAHVYMCNIWLSTHLSSQQFFADMFIVKMHNFAYKWWIHVVFQTAFSMHARQQQRQQRANMTNHKNTDRRLFSSLPFAHTVIVQISYDDDNSTSGVRVCVYPSFHSHISIDVAVCISYKIGFPFLFCVNAHCNCKRIS